jgi:hypothetical protein
LALLLWLAQRQASFWAISILYLFVVLLPIEKEAADASMQAERESAPDHWAAAAPVQSDAGETAAADRGADADAAALAAAAGANRTKCEASAALGQAGGGASGAPLRGKDQSAVHHGLAGSTSSR